MNGPVLVTRLFPFLSLSLLAPLAGCSAEPEGVDASGTEIRGPIRFEDMTFEAWSGRAAVIELGPGDDLVRVSHGDADFLTIEVNGTTTKLRSSAVAGFVITGGGGDDRIELATPRLPMHARVDGGDGDDWLQVDTAGHSVVLGGNGDDYLEGSWQPDVLDGGDGDDRIWAGPRSIVVTGAGFDHVIRGAETWVTDADEEHDTIE